ncbi:hypothetical protein GF352_04795 [archaeon]|nr:hypothetical protein [archaeon]
MSNYYFCFMRISVVLLFFLCLSPVFASQCSTALVGVMETPDGFEGVLANLTVSMAPGSGKVWVDTMPLTKVETQVSARMARDVACELLSVNCSSIDFYYLMRSDYIMVGGPSAGAPMAVCTMALLLNKSLDPGVVMTGTINPDGSVGPVGSIDAKARALTGYDTLLVPEGSFFNESDVYGVELVNVADVLEAFSYYTGYDVVFTNVSSEELVSADYLDLMQLMSDDLISVAGDYLNGSVAGSLLNESRDFYGNASYYSAASLAVRSLINSIYDSNLYLLNESPESINDLLVNVSSRVDEFKQSFINDLLIDHLYDLEGFAITMDRVSEAEDMIAEGLNSSDAGEALFLYSFAETRLITAYQWSFILDYFSSDKVVDFDLAVIKPLIIERLEAARNAITYAKTIVGPEYLAGAEDHLNNAVNSYNRDGFIYALFESLKARAEANLLMELRGLDDLSDRIAFKRDSAERAVSKSMSRGYLPLLALSYLEYSMAFEDDPFQELIFLAYAKEFASLGSSINEFVKYSRDSYSVPYQVTRQFDYGLLRQGLLVILGFVLGLVAALSGVGG